jgi:hypothetical protein
MMTIPINARPATNDSVPIRGPSYSISHKMAQKAYKKFFLNCFVPFCGKISARNRLFKPTK